MSWTQRIQDSLSQRRADNQWRQRQTVESPQGRTLRIHGQTLLNFCSNDYLGLAEQGGPALQRAAIQWGLGSGASHLVCGHSQAHHDLEQALARHTGYSRVLLFSTGYMANLGCIQALTQRGDGIFQDKLNHASLIDGALLSRADFQRYPHQNYRNLATRLQQREQGLSLVVSDSIFSMDGDLADVNQLADLCQQHNALLMIDDAHGFGVLGNQGAGIRNDAGLRSRELPLYVGTLGKALGGFGAFVAGDDALIDYLIQFARPYIYTTAIPPAVAEAMLDNLERLQNDDLRTTLNGHIQYFREQAQHRQLPLMASQSPIQPLLIGDERRAMSISQALRQRGLLITAIRPPTVPAGTSRLRVTLTAAHTREDIDTLLDALTELLDTETTGAAR
ncbi:MAG: 8-amino-7-oxononanoate synthase [Oceanobacter sp.]